MRKELYFKIKNKIDDLEYMNFTVQGFLEAHDIGEMVIFNVNLVLEELITNIIKYGYEGTPGQNFVKINLSLSTPGEIYIKLEDCGVPFNPMEAPEPDMDMEVEQMKIGGLGLHLVKNIISKIDYKREKNKNIQQIWLAIE